MRRPAIAGATEEPPSPALMTSDTMTPSRLRLLKSARSSPAAMGAILVVLVAFFAIMRPDTFATALNIRNIFLDASTLLIMSVGMTYVMIGGGFDLSIGSVLVFAGVMAAELMYSLGDNVLSVLAGGLAALGCGLAWGIFNGFCITRLRVPALITTLGSMGAALGLAELITGGNDVRSVPDALVTVGTTGLAGVPWLVMAAAVVTVIGGVWLHMTRFGRHTYLIGSNPEAARRLGINVRQHLLALYMLSGLLAGLAAMLSLGRFATTTIEGHTNDPLEAITAVVLGGTSLFGGRGTVVGTVVGVFIPAVLANGFIILGIEPFWQQVVIGFVLIGAVYIDQLKRSSRERG